MQEAVQHDGAGHTEEKAVLPEARGVPGIPDPIDGAEGPEDDQAERDAVGKGRIVYHGASRANPWARTTG